MNILITGASGFVASQIVSDLIAAGHHVTCCVRDIATTEQRFPSATVLSCDFIKDTTPEVWVARLKGIEVVINCVGILYHPNKKIIWAVHTETPRALFDACVTAGVKKIIQISALGADQSDTEYAKSKKAAEDHLLKLPIKSIILRPSLIYGQGSYGGSSLFRGLSGLPWMTPVPGKGDQEFQPIHLADLSQAIVKFIEMPLEKTEIFSAVSEQRISLVHVLSTLRAWLGFKKSRSVFVPLFLIRLGSWFGDFIPYSAMNSSSYKMLIQSNIASELETKKFHQKIGFTPRDFATGIHRFPSSVQDRWHARLFFLKPLLQVTLAFLWLATAAITLFIAPRAYAYTLLSAVGIPTALQPMVLTSSCLLDGLIGILILIGYRIKAVCVIQLIVIIAYTAILSWTLPTLWLDPFGPLLKNIPILVAILAYRALESDR